MLLPKKLIEVALPLEDINRESAREKSIRHGHPSTLHLWWARRPLAAARAVLFAQLVNDPGDAGRESLFDLIKKLVKWENINNETLLEQARAEIRKSWEQTCKITGEDPAHLPPFSDPFCGGGSIPLEAQRLGLEVHASDLNPVAVMITKALIEIPPKFAGRKPVGPLPEGEIQKNFKRQEDWSGAKGLAEDVRRYGLWMRNEAEKRIGHLYPKVRLPKEYGQEEATVIAWIWARTVKCPNPACGCEMPLVRSFDLSTKPKNQAWIEPIVDRQSQPPKIIFTVKTGEGKGCEGTVNRNGARCICCNTPVPLPYVRSEGKAGRIKEQLMAVITEGKKGRVYSEPTEDMESIAKQAYPQNFPVTDLPKKALGFRVQEYGMSKHCNLFTSRQLVALTTLSELVSEARKKVIQDAIKAGWEDDEKGLSDGGTGATAYGDAVSVYLAFTVDKVADRNSSIVSWAPNREHARNTFGRQAIPMTWDFAESNPFCDSSGNFEGGIKSIFNGLLSINPNCRSIANQVDATMCQCKNVIVSTDPPYFDNIGYADLSDFFYTWLRRSLKSIFPEIFSTLLAPKEQELIASPYRHGSKEKAELFFMTGMTKALKNMADSTHAFFPVTIYYAFKQSETSKEGTVSKGWDTFLEAIMKSGFSITGTWPIRTELERRMIGRGTNALASSIIIVCRKRPTDASIISRKQFLRELDDALPEALETMIGGKSGSNPIAPVDLAQSAIGPGMAVFSKYAQVFEADGTPMSVRAALMLINKAIDEYFTQAESDMDSDTRFCVNWFQQYGFKEGVFGEADVLARAKGTSVDGVCETGVIQSGKGKIRLLKASEYPKSWNPQQDKRIPVWEACHHIIRVLQESESSAGRLLAFMI